LRIAECVSGGARHGPAFTHYNGAGRRLE
jgi:hypothetical protein